MTKSVWRFLLTCLLLVALPSQGFAATGASVCGPNHHQIFSSPSLVSELGARTLQDLPDKVSHHNAATSDAHDASDYVGQSSIASQDPGSIGSTTNVNSNFKCKNCAPCCVNAMLTGDIVTPIARSVGQADFPALITVLTFPPLGSLDRPPRLLLA